MYSAYWEHQANFFNPLSSHFCVCTIMLTLHSRQWQYGNQLQVENTINNIIAKLVSFDCFFMWGIKLAPLVKTDCQQGGVGDVESCAEDAEILEDKVEEIGQVDVG